MRKLFWVMVGFCLSWPAVAAIQTDDIFQYPFYVGAMGGFGSTTWQGLVPQTNDQNLALSFSTPIGVEEGGGLWGLAAGYEITPCFALEANYTHYPSATLSFDPDSLFAFEKNGMTTLSTETQTGSLSAKLMVILPRNTLRVFSSAGIATVVRQDDINTIYRISPVFGFGVNLLVNKHVMLEIGSTYTAGYGESEINPVQDFIPFLYSIFAKLALRF